MGTANGADAPSLTPVEEASLRQKQAEAQAEDAIKRNVAWDAEAGLDVDADGEDDPDYADGVFVGNVDDSGVEFPVPIGIRMEDGEIKPLPLEFIKTRSSPRQSNSANSAMEVDEGAERHYAGYPEKVPSHAGALVRIPHYRTLTRHVCLPLSPVDWEQSHDRGALPNSTNWGYTVSWNF